MSNQITPKEFILRALKIAEREKGIARIHTVWDGLNAALRDYYGKDADVISMVNTLVKKGIIKGWPIKGGFMVALVSEIDKKKPTKGRELLEKIKQFEK